MQPAQTHRTQIDCALGFTVAHLLSLTVATTDAPTCVICKLANVTAANCCATDPGPSPHDSKFSPDSLYFSSKISLRLVAECGIAPSSAVVGKAKEPHPSSGKIFKFGSKPGILIQTPAGEFRAFSAICTHLGCIVQYRPDLRHIWCACHNGHYDLYGRNIAGPPPRPLERYQVNIRGDEIIVSKG
ncbi:MAG: Rieske (2Fe-2S) protein [Acidobacteria bacterium]|nr:MAG: Rieske (2Fe-2S) protein [Acidobacteriota bacterium]